MTVEPDAHRRTRADRLAGGYRRREFLILALSVLGPAASGGGCGRPNPAEPEGLRQAGELPGTRVDLEALLDRYFAYGDTADVRAIGRAYIERFEGDERALADDLAHSVRWLADIDSTDVALGALAAAVNGDFANDRRTTLGGWQLATTEARLCALVEYLASARD